VLTTGNGSLPGNRTTIVGRQCLFKGRAPIFDIVDNPDGHTFMLAEPYAEVSGPVNFEISNVYFTPELANSNFESMRVFTDPPQGVQIPFGFSIEEINNIDPQRTSRCQ